MRRAGPPREIPPPLELECLKTLWKLGEGSVKQVRADLLSSRSLAYTTVMTLLDRLAKKGAVERKKVGRSFVYAPVLSRELLRRLAVKQLVDCFFSGSEDELVVYLRGRGVNSERLDSPDSSLDTALL